MGEVVRSRPKLVTVLALLAIGAGLMLGLASKAIALEEVSRYRFEVFNNLDTGYGQVRDGNGSLPEYYQTVGLNGVVPPQGTCDDEVVGYAYKYIGGSGWSGPQANGVVYQRYVYYDDCEMARVYKVSCGLDGAAADWDALLRHERAHTRGFAHLEGAASYNPAYNPVAFDYIPRGC